jgi:hypothetical protein
MSGISTQRFYDDQYAGSEYAAPLRANQHP